MKVNIEDLFQLIEEGERLSIEKWRWGTNECFHVRKDDKDYIVWVRFHMTEGIQDEEFDLIPAKKIKKIVTEWVAI